MLTCLFVFCFREGIKNIKICVKSKEYFFVTENLLRNEASTMEKLKVNSEGMSLKRFLPA